LVFKTSSEEYTVKQRAISPKKRSNFRRRSSRDGSLIESQPIVVKISVAKLTA
jgi:hypothetical protein